MREKLSADSPSETTDTRTRLDPGPKIDLGFVLYM
jgi:hypothetical protein